MSTPPGPTPPPPAGWSAHPPTGPVGPTPEERNWALAAHIGAIVVAWFAMGFLCPLVVLLVKGNESPFVRRHAVEALNFQISLLVYLLISVILAVILIGFLLMAAIGVFALVVIIIATVRASAGEDYRYPLTIRLVH